MSVSTAPFRETVASRRGVLCKHSTFSTDASASRCAGEYCVRTAPFRETVASRRGVLCKHSTFSTYATAQHLSTGRVASRRGVLCKHSTFSTDASASRCAAEYCVSTAPFRPTQPRSTFRPTVLRRAGGSTVYAQHLFDRRDRRRVARQSTVYAQHLFDRREPVASRAAENCVSAASVSIGGVTAFRHVSECCVSAASFRPTALRRAGGVLCKHSTFSTDPTHVGSR